jgi:hypothetical protein
MKIGLLKTLSGIARAAPGELVKSFANLNRIPSSICRPTMRTRWKRLPTARAQAAAPLSRFIYGGRVGWTDYGALLPTRSLYAAVNARRSYLDGGIGRATAAPARLNPRSRIMKASSI